MLLYAYVKYILRIYGISQLYIREVSMFISYDYYRIFYYVAKYGNISKAAKVLLSSQPNVTRTIKNLEGELGCTLFSRTSRGMRLTPEGERLYGHVPRTSILRQARRSSGRAKLCKAARSISRRARWHCDACCCPCSSAFACCTPVFICE